MKSLTALLATTRALLIAALVLLPFSLPQAAYAAATTQTTHAYLCSSQSFGTGAASRRVVNTSTTAATAYTLNAVGCAVFAAADIGFFLSQGFSFGAADFVLQQQAITANTTSSTSTITLPAYGMIKYIILEETAGNAVTGGVDIGDSGSATRFASAVALSANNTVIVTDSALTRIFANSGVPAADQILVVCHTACNSASINISVVYAYY